MVVCIYRYLLRLTFFWLVLFGYFTSPAMADDTCGGVGQFECGLLAQFPSCNATLTASGGKCYQCGGEGELECAFSVQMPSCDPGRSARAGRCYGCGGVGEYECDITVQFPSCDAGLNAYGGRCETCGALGERECHASVQIPSCDAGLNAYGGRCEVCGGLDERECHVSVQLPSCDKPYAASEGFCTFCGGLGQIPCPLSVRVPSCDFGLEEHFFEGTCSNDTIAQVHEASIEKLGEIGGNLVLMMGAAILVGLEDELARLIENRDPSAADTARPNPAVNPCVMEQFNAWTLGGTADINVVLGGILESGMSVDISPAGRSGNQRSAYWYGGASYGFGLSVGASAGLNYGCWVAQNDQISGDTHGMVYDIFELIPIIQAIRAREITKVLNPGVSMAVGVWFDESQGEFPGTFQGITLTPAVGQGIDLGGYVRGTVLQFPD